MIVENSKYNNNNYSNFDHSKVLPRHRWYHFKEGFSPLVVQDAINSAKLKKDDLIIDPFSGSGTVPLVSGLEGYKSIGFEVNPFMSFISNTKQNKVSAKLAIKHSSKIKKVIDKGYRSPVEGFSTFTESNKNEKWLFNTDVIRAFQGGLEYTKTISPKLGNIFKLCLLSSVMDNCNAFKDGKCLRYKKEWRRQPYNKESFMNNFNLKLKEIIEDLENSPPVFQNKVINGDVRASIRKNLKEKFKLCVTSPPYLNSFDYTDIYRPELFIGEFIKSHNELRNLRLKTLRSHVQVNWKEPTHSDFGTLYQNCFNRILERRDSLWNKKIPMMIQAYFEDMRNILIMLKEKADRNASLWIVVSTSAYAGVEIPVDLILADIGTSIGWELKEVAVTRHLRNSTQNAQRYNNGEASSKRLRESIVMLEAR